MMTFSEWELFFISQDLELGDTVEIGEGKKKTLGVLVKVQNHKAIVMCKGQVKRSFNCQNLKEVTGKGTLLGKANTELRMKDL